MVKQVAAAEAQGSLGSLLDLVEQGEEIVILRDGRLTAKLVAVAQQHNSLSSMAAVERIRARALRLHENSPVTLMEILSWRDEGRH